MTPTVKLYYAALRPWITEGDIPTEGFAGPACQFFFLYDSDKDLKTCFPMAQLKHCCSSHKLMQYLLVFFTEWLIIQYWMSGFRTHDDTVWAFDYWRWPADCLFLLSHVTWWLDIYNLTGDQVEVSKNKYTICQPLTSHEKFFRNAKTSKFQIFLNFSPSPSHP